GVAGARPQAAATSIASTPSPVRTIDASPATRPQMFGRNIKPLQGTIARAAQLVNVGPDNWFRSCPSDVLSPAQSGEYPAKPGEGGAASVATVRWREERWRLAICSFFTMVAQAW